MMVQEQAIRLVPKVIVEIVEKIIEVPQVSSEETMHDLESENNR